MYSALHIEMQREEKKTSGSKRTKRKRKRELGVSRDCERDQLRIQSNKLNATKAPARTNKYTDRLTTICTKTNIKKHTLFANRRAHIVNTTMTMTTQKNTHNQHTHNAWCHATACSTKALHKTIQFTMVTIPCVRVLTDGQSYMYAPCALSLSLSLCVCRSVLIVRLS